MLAQEIIRRKRDGHALRSAEIEAFVQGLSSGSWSEGQCAALAMAVFLRGMTASEKVDLTRAMTHSGRVMDWSQAGLDGPVLDKHSTGGVGDKVSLMLGPIVAACGGYVPMVSGRGLGHTGGTLDKLQALPGYMVTPRRAQLVRVLREELADLMHAGVSLVQLDEPVLSDVVFSGQKSKRSFMCGALSETEGPEHELGFARALVNAVVEGFPRERIALHVCRGNWTPDESVALSGSYAPLVPTLAGMKVGAYLLEACTPRAGDMALLGWSEADLMR